MPQRLEEAVSIFPVLGHRLKQKAETLSGGEQETLAIARGLMGDPEIAAVG